MRARSRAEQRRVRACRAAARWLRAQGLAAPPDAAALERLLVVLDRSMLGRAQELQARAEREQSLRLVDQADALLVAAQRARDLRAELLEAVALKPTHVCPCCGAVCPPSKPGRGRARRYCSDECRSAARSERRSDAISAATLAVRLVPRPCAVCGHHFTLPARGRPSDRCAEHRGRRLPPMEARAA